MKTMKVVYSDQADVRKTRFETKPYPALEAHAIARCLEGLGCVDFEFVEVKK